MRQPPLRERLAKLTPDELREALLETARGDLVRLEQLALANDDRAEAQRALRDLYDALDATDDYHEFPFATVRNNDDDDRWGIAATDLYRKTHLAEQPAAVTNTFMGAMIPWTRQSLRGVACHLGPNLRCLLCVRFALSWLESDPASHEVPTEMFYRHAVGGRADHGEWWLHEENWELAARHVVSNRIELSLNALGPSAPVGLDLQLLDHEGLALRNVQLVCGVPIALSTTTDGGELFTLDDVATVRFRELR